MRHRAPCVTFVLLVAWVLLGPIGMAFDACGAMMALCEIPCGAPSVVMNLTPTLSTLAQIAMLPASSSGHPSLTRDAGLDPPPKFRLSA